MSKTIHDAAYGDLLAWLKSERGRRNRETGGKCTMRTLAPLLSALLWRPKLKFSWVAKIEQGDRRIDLLEYTAYCVALGIDPHEGVRRLVERLGGVTGNIVYPLPPPGAIRHAAESGAPPSATARTPMKDRRKRSRNQ